MTTFPPAIGAPPTPDLGALLGQHLPDVLAACTQHAGPITRIKRATGGNVSHVFRVYGDTGRVILKIRGNCFANIPTISTDPTLIADEHYSLQVYGRALPGLFPTILEFLPNAHAMVMTDVFPDRRNWHEHLNQRPATTNETVRLGQALARVHNATAVLRTPIRCQGDDWFREHTFDFCLRPSQHPALLDACTELATLPDQQLVLGDVAPKNLSLAADRVAFVDLDNVHRNAPLYDVAYLLAHILLHHLRWPTKAPTLTTALLDAYAAATREHNRRWAHDTLMAAVAAGVILYRLDARITPYPPTAPPAVSQRYHGQVMRLLNTGAFTVPDLLAATEQASR